MTDLSSYFRIAHKLYRRLVLGGRQLMGNNSFIRGAAILAGAGLITKLIGALYRIPFARIVGEEGMGLYQMAYPVYTMILAFATAGIPVAISLLVSQCKSNNDVKGMEKIFFVSLVMLICLGVVSSYGLYKGAYFLANKVLHDDRAFYPLVTLAPALFFAAVISAFRGYFQGMMTMVPTAISQIVEQVVRVATVFMASYLLLSKGIEFAAAGATFGAVTGSLAALLVLIAYYSWWKYKTRYRAKNQKTPLSVLFIIKRVALLAIPISLGGLVMPLMQTIDAAMVPLRLQVAGYDVSSATAIFGQFSGMAATLINLPTIVTISLAASLVPAISDALAKANKQLIVARLNEAIRLTIIICLPAAVGLFLLAEEIAVLLYGIPEVGISIRVLAPAALFLGLHQTTAGAIQGLGKTYLPVRNLFIGALVKISLNYYLTAIPALGIRGAGLATVFSFMIAFTLNFKYLWQNNAFKMGLTHHLIKPIIAVTIMAISILGSKMLLSYNVVEEIKTMLLILIGIISYGIALLITGGVKRADLEIIPFIGENLAKILMKLRLVRW